jgi:hypothetical protein
MISYIRWIEHNHSHSTDYYLVSGAIRVGVARYNLSRSKDDGPENSYAWGLLLPGKDRKGVAPTLEQAKANTEAAFHDWCAKANLGATKA